MSTSANGPDPGESDKGSERQDPHQPPYQQGPYGQDPYQQDPYQPPYQQGPSGQGPYQQDPYQPPYQQGSGRQPSPYQPDPYQRAPYGQAPGQPPYGQNGYQQAGYNQVPYGQPYAPQKSRVVAGVLGILLGSLGVHRFYLGFTTIGIIQILMSTVGAMFTFGLSAIAAGIWGLIEGIMILVGSEQFRRDARGVPLKD